MIPGSAVESVLQGDGVGRSRRSGRALSLGTLILIRWISLVFQIALLALAHLVFELRLPILACGATIAVGFAVNLGLGVVGQRGRLVSDVEATLQLGFDLLQLSALLYLTGGVIDPFGILLIAPVR